MFELRRKKFCKTLFRNFDYHRISTIAITLCAIIVLLPIKPIIGSPDQLPQNFAQPQPQHRVIVDDSRKMPFPIGQYRPEAWMRSFYIPSMYCLDHEDCGHHAFCVKGICTCRFSFMLYQWPDHVSCERFPCGSDSACYTLPNTRCINEICVCDQDFELDETTQTCEPVFWTTSVTIAISIVTIFIVLCAIIFVLVCFMWRRRRAADYDNESMQREMPASRTTAFRTRRQ